MTAPDLANLTRNAVDVLPEGELERKLAAGRPLRVKLGIDVTAPDVHVGHAIPPSAWRRSSARATSESSSSATTRPGSATRPPLERAPDPLERRDRDEREDLSRPGRADRRHEPRAARGQGSTGSGWRSSTSPRSSATRTITVARLLERRLPAAVQRGCRSRSRSCSTRSCRPTTGGRGEGRRRAVALTSSTTSSPAAT